MDIPICLLWHELLLADDDGAQARDEFGILNQITLWLVWCTVIHYYL